MTTMAMLICYLEVEVESKRVILPCCRCQAETCLPK
jgi:hypothetical protein